MDTGETWEVAEFDKNCDKLGIAFVRDETEWYSQEEFEGDEQSKIHRHCDGHSEDYSAEHSNSTKCMGYHMPWKLWMVTC